MRKLFIVAGERSGDLHAGHVCSEIRRADPECDLVGFGGDEMKSAGVRLLAHYSEYSVMGFIEVLKGIKKIREYLAKCKKAIIDEKPEAVILVDFGGFNLKIAKFCKGMGIKVFYYIPPKVWAWNTSRVRKIKKYTDKVLVIFPFEEAFFKQNGVEAVYVGNPTREEVDAFQSEDDFKSQFPADKPLVAMLPGSREQELNYISESLLGTIRSLPQVHFAIAGVSNLDPGLYSLFKSQPNVSVVLDKAYHLLNVADAAVVTSGTATLETALFKVPQVVVYRTSTVSYAVAKRVIKVPYISLVNLILEKEAVTELIQENCTSEKITEILNQIMYPGTPRETQLADYDRLRSTLGQLPCARKVASEVLGKSI